MHGPEEVLVNAFQEKNMQSFVWVIVEVPLFSVELTDYKINKAAGNNAS